MIRVLIADDHGLVREGLKQLFLQLGEVTVVAEATNGSEVLSALHAGGIDLLLLDMTMPGINGVDLIARVRSHMPHLPILVLSMLNETLVAKRALQSGASGYLTKDSDPGTLLMAIKRVAAGGRYIDATLAEQIAFDIGSRGQRSAQEELSSREYQILCQLAKGLSLNEIADDLSISSKTVSTYKARLMEKMQFKSNAEMIRYAVAHGLTQ